MSSFDHHIENLQNPPIEYRPEIRWWLAEGLHTDETLRREIDAAHRLGFGGMEFLAMDEGDVDHARYGWGAEEWIHDSQIVVEETTKRKMSVSFTSGTNWSNANVPGIDPDHDAAAKELNFTAEDLAGGAGRQGPLSRIDLDEDRGGSSLPGHRVAPTRQDLVAVIAVPVLSDGTLDAGAVLDLTDDIEGESLDWSAPAGQDWRLFTFWMHGTGQTASPSATVNYTVNYLDLAGVTAVTDYWTDHVLTPELRAQIAANPRTQMYMDSLELGTWGPGGMFWGRSVADEFRTRRGYDIAPWLPFLVRTTQMMAVRTTYTYEPPEKDRATVEKVRFDYVKTLTDLYIECMLRPFATFLHENGITLRSEISYGLPFELTRPGPEVDGIETESLEFGSQIDGYRLLAGPAHLFDKQYSSETGATSRNHMLDHRFYDQIIATQFAAGVTKTVLHGWASPAGAEGATEWPGHEGMWPMFSERFDTRQPGSEFYPLWNDAMGRYQYLLRQGRPRVDVGIIRTDHFTDNTVGMALIDEQGNRIADEDAYGQQWMRNRENHWWRDLGMQDAGWTYEFLDGSLLLHDDVSFGEGVVQPGGPGYQALLVYQDALDADVAALLMEWAKEGLPILIVNGASEVKLLLARAYQMHERAAVRTPGLDGRDDELQSILEELTGLSNVAVIDDPSETISALRGLGVTGRAEFTADNTDVLSCLREEGDLLHLYAYHFLYETGETTTVEFALPGTGTVHRIDAWSGEVRRHLGTRIDGDRTIVTVQLAPGETALLTLDRSAPESQTEESAPTHLRDLTDWSISVESWDAGETEIISEDRGLGYVTREARPTTTVTPIPAQSNALAPWTELPGVGPEVSGIGSYATTFSLEESDVDGARIILDLGSTEGGLGAVSVNGRPSRGFDTSHPVVDITRDVVPGANEIVVRVSSSLNNRLIARGYYAKVIDVVGALSGATPGPHSTRVRPYGLTGPVALLRIEG